MRTDVKYGVIIAVCVALLISAWCLVFRGESTPRETTAAGAGNNDTTLVGMLPADEVPTPPPVEFSPSPEVIRPDYGTHLAAEEAPSPGTDLAALGGVRDPLVPAPRPQQPEAALARLPDPVAPPVAYTDPLAPSPAAATAGKGKTYEVKQGDSYWAIALRQYGDASLFKVIEDANPKIAAKDLKPGMTISIPAKPAAAVRVAAVSTPPAAAHGKVDVDPVTGKTYYVVKAGDRGFWDVSVAVFKGEGKHYLAIEKANPDRDPRKLHPGDKIWVPVLPATPVAIAARTPPAPRPAPSTGGGQTIANVTIRTGAPTRARLPGGAMFD